MCRGSEREEDGGDSEGGRDRQAARGTEMNWILSASMIARVAAGAGAVVVVVVIVVVVVVVAVAVAVAVKGLCLCASERRGVGARGAKPRLP